MKTLVDSSVWINHFKKSDRLLIELLERDEVILHQFVIEELYLGRPNNKKLVFERLEKLPFSPTLSSKEVFHFMDLFKISGKGVGLVDTHLIASAYLNKLKLYTHDKALKNLANIILGS